MVWRSEDPQGNEADKVRYDIVPYTRGYGIDVGCGPWKAFPHFIGVDRYCCICGGTRAHKKGCPSATSIDIFHIAESLPLFADLSLDFVFSSHLLEHLHNYEATLKDWWRTIKYGGYLVLYLPHADFYPNTPEEGGNPEHIHNFRPRDIIAVMKKMATGWDLVVSEERNEGNEYSFLQVYKKLSGKKGHLFSYYQPDPVKRCLVVRYGGIGDMMMTSSILPHLKRAGWHVVVNTTPKGYEIIKNDPHVDEFMLQDTDQVPREELVPYWKHISRKYDKFINLSESVEGTFLALEGRTLHTWPQKIRHRLVDKNYLEFTHLLAGIPYEPAPRFYPSKTERKWAEKTRRSMGDGKVVLWILSGSSVHKAYPYTDAVVARIMLEYKDVKVVFAGDGLCAFLEEPWSKESRVVRTSGKWSIRQVLAFAELADVVVGPETGVMNAVSHRAVPKVIMMSHSSVQNLTRDWTHCTSLEPKGCECYPCHMMHYGFEYCTRDEKTGGALCQARISPDRVMDAIAFHLNRAEKRNGRRYNWQGQVLQISR